MFCVIIIIINMHCSLVAAIFQQEAVVASAPASLSPGYYKSSALNEPRHPWLLSRIPIQLQVFSSYLLWCYIASGCATGDPHRVSSACHVLNFPPALGSWLSCRMVSTSQDCMSPGTSLWETMPYHLVWSVVLRNADRICLVIECGDGRCHFHKQD